MPHLRFFGGATVESNSAGASSLASRHRPMALLALLAAAPGNRLSRARVLSLLWPDVPEEKARNRLTSCLYQLRQDAGSDSVLSVGAELLLNTDVVRCDVVGFDAAIAAGDHAAAVALYRGEFLQSFWISGSPDFDHWTDFTRDRLRRDYLVSLDALATAAAASGHAEEAVRYRRLAVQQDPHDSSAVQRLVRALTAAGNRAEAMRVAEAHDRLLMEEFGEDSDGAITALARSAPRAVVSVAVLPFESLGMAAEAEPFTIGMHEDLLTELSRISSLDVISRISVMAYRDSAKPAVDVGRELGASAVVQAAVQCAAGRVRLNVRLVDARTDRNLWVDRYDRELTTANIFDVQAELAERIAAALRARLQPGGERTGPDGSHPTASLEAYRLHALGRRWLDSRTEDGMRRALGYFRDSRDEDPGYALAWAGVATALALLLDYGHERGDDLTEEAETAARHALGIVPDLAEAYGALAALAGARAERGREKVFLQRAIELNPNYAEAHNWLSWHNLVVGRGAPALAAARRAVALDPLAAEAVSNLSLSYMANGRPRDGLREALRARELQPEWDTGPFYQGLALYHLDRHDEVVETLEGISVAWAGSGAELTLGLSHVALGNMDAADRILADFESAGDAYAAGVLHLACGRRSRAWHYLEQADCASYWPSLSLRFFYPEVLAPLADRPLYRKLLGRTQGTTQPLAR